MIPAVQTRDGAARERIRNSLDESLIVEASAGTGKTSELIRRIVRVLATGTPVEKIVAVTFTHKAAGELKIRLREELDKARAACADTAERAHLEDALERLEEAAIGTIHGFCAQILRERPVEARIDPAFEELTDQESARFFGRAFDQWFQQKLDSGGDALRRALARLAWRESWQSDPPVEALKYVGRQLVEWRDHEAPWRVEPFDRAAWIAVLAGQCTAITTMLRQSNRLADNLVRSLRPVKDLIEWLERAELAGQRDYDALEARLLKLERDLKRDSKKGSGAFAPGISRQDVLDARAALLGELDRFRTAAGADFAAALHAEMRDLVRTYIARKQRAGKLDFLDLLVLVRDLVRDNREVRNYLQARFARIFVDEFQDTDPLQAEILILLSADDPAQNDWLQVTPVPGKLFVVGDPKQSIYKFRRADVVLYQSVSEALASRGVARLHLTTSFRAVRPIQQLVNAAFAPEMTGDRHAGQARYAPLEEHTPPWGTQPAVVVLPAPVSGGHRITKTEIEACMPDAIAGYIEWLVKASGWQVRDPRDGAPVPLQCRHICVLFRKMLGYRGVDLSRAYTQALEGRNIPHLLVGSKSFYHREEVEIVRVALAAIEWPGDELSVFGALHGSLFAIPDDLLLRFRFEVGRLHPFRSMPENLAPAFAPIGQALGILAELHRQRNARPVADTINALLEATRAHAGFFLRRSGWQTLANVYRICDSARAYEATGGLSFRGFLEDIAAQADKADFGEAPVLEESSDGVRLMTVHSAKGLEFPVVILADITTNIARAEAERFVDGGLCATRLLGAAPWELLENESQEHAREIAEGVRVAYVAATRARDLLVIPAVGDGEREGWLQPLNKAIFPPLNQRRTKAAARGCPAFSGEGTVLLAPPGDSVQPGLHTPQCGDHQIVWWDPLGLRLGVSSGIGLRQEDILAPEPAARADEGTAQYQRWQSARQQTLTTGAAPAFQVVSPTEGLEDPPERRAVQVESIANDAARPGGRRFGTLVHAILRDLDLRGAAAQIAALAQVHARLLDAPREEADAAATAVQAAWSHPLLERARAAERCHRELPIHLRLEDGRLLEAVIDLAFLEQDRWVVVDFKSDASATARYERQVQWYLYALAKLTKREAAGYLLHI